MDKLVPKTYNSSHVFANLLILSELRLQFCDTSLSSTKQLLFTLPRVSLEFMSQWSSY